MANKKERLHLVHSHSSIYDKQPSGRAAEDMLIGELAVNNNAGHEFISTKNSEGDIIRFSSDAVIGRLIMFESGSTFPSAQQRWGGNSAEGKYSLSANEGAKSINEAETSLGRFNKPSKESDMFGHSGNTIFTVGNGSSDSARSNVIDARQNGDVYIDGRVTAPSITVKNGPNYFSGYTQSSGVTNIYGETNISGSTHIDGPTNIEGPTTVEGPTNITGDTYISGSTNIEGPTNISGETKISGDTNITGTTTISGDTYISGSTNIDGPTNISGTTNILGDTNISGTTNISGDTNVTGPTNLSGDTFIQSGDSMINILQVISDSARDIDINPVSSAKPENSIKVTVISNSGNRTDHYIKLDTELSSGSVNGVQNWVIKAAIDALSATTDSIYEMLINDELVISAALNDLDGRVLEGDRAQLEDEEVVAAALNDLNDRLKENTDMIMDRIDNMDLEPVYEKGKAIVMVRQDDGQVSAETGDIEAEHVTTVTSTTTFSGTTVQKALEEIVNRMDGMDYGPLEEDGKAIVMVRQDNGQVSAKTGDVAASHTTTVTANTEFTGTTVQLALEELAKKVKANRVTNADGSITVTSGANNTDIHVHIVNGEPVLSNSNGLKTTIKLKKVSQTASSPLAAQYKLVGIDGNTALGDTIDVPKDQFLNRAYLADKNKHEIPSGDTTTVAFYLALELNVVSGGSYAIQTQYIPVGSFLQEMEAGSGLSVSDGILNIVPDGNSDTKKFLVIGEDTLGLSGITDAIQSAETNVLDIIKEDELVISAALNELDGRVIEGDKAQLEDEEVVAAALNELNDRLIETTENIFDNLNGLSAETQSIRNVSITGTNGLTGGGDLSEDRVIGMPVVVTAGTYIKNKVDQYGRITSGNPTIEITDVVNLTETISGVSGQIITNRINIENLSGQVIDDELVVSAALNELDGRVIEGDNAQLEDEEVVAAALNDINDRLYDEIQDRKASEEIINISINEIDDRKLEKDAIHGTSPIIVNNNANNDVEIAHEEHSAITQGEVGSGNVYLVNSDKFGHTIGSRLLAKADIEALGIASKTLTINYGDSHGEPDQKTYDGTAEQTITIPRKTSDISRESLTVNYGKPSSSGAVTYDTTSASTVYIPYQQSDLSDYKTPSALTVTYGGDVTTKSAVTYDTKSNQSIVIPTKTSDISRESLEVTYGGDVTSASGVTYDTTAKKSIKIPTSTADISRKSLTTKYGKPSSTAYVVYDTTSGQTITIPSQLSDLSDYKVPSALTVSYGGDVTSASGIIYDTTANQSIKIPTKTADISRESLTAKYGKPSSTSDVVYDTTSGQTITIPSQLSDLSDYKTPSALTVTYGGDVTSQAGVTYDTTANQSIKIPTKTADISRSALTIEYGSVTASTNESYDTTSAVTIKVPKNITDLEDGGAFVHITGDTMSGNLVVGTGTTNVTVSTGGTVVASGAIYSSDRNLKKDIMRVTQEEMDKLNRVALSSFYFKEGDNRKRFGVIAQDVAAAGLDNLVVETNGRLGVDYISLLILKVAQLEAEIEKLKEGR